MACRRWVFPSPTEACRNNGLKRTAPPGADSATVRAAAQATRLEDPSTKESNVYLPSSGEPRTLGRPAISSRGAALLARVATETAPAAKADVAVVIDGRVAWAFGSERATTLRVA